MTALWLADVIRAAGVPVVEHPGWEARAQSGAFTPRGLIRHWDASSPGSHGAVDYMAANIACNITTCRGDAGHGPSVHVLAAGLAWHAGTGQFGVFPRDQGNAYAVGHEIAHTVDEPWSDAQLDVVVAAERAILDHLRADVDDAWCTHSEYAPGRKIDTTGGAFGQNPAHERARLAGELTPTTIRKAPTMLIFSTPDGRLWITDGIRKRRLYDMGEAHRYLDNGVPDAGTWHSAEADRLITDAPESTDDADA